MAVRVKYLPDIEAILLRRHSNGANFWTTPDKRLPKGSSFSAYSSALMLVELGVEPIDAILEEVVELFLNTWQEGGRFKLYPQDDILPCHTAHTAYLLCHMGCAQDERTRKTFRHLLEIQPDDGGLRYNKFSFGHGPKTESPNPGPTFTALNAFRFADALNREPALNKAVGFLLEYWVIKKPTGPCHCRIGTLFM